MKTLQITKPEILHKGPYVLEHGYSTDVQVTALPRADIRPKLVVFDQPTPLLVWCRQSGYNFAINGGFTLHHRENRPTELLGMYRVAGKTLNTIPFSTPRSGIHFSPEGEISLRHRSTGLVPEEGDFFQAGPMLLMDGVVLVTESSDFEGVAMPPLQMDDDWTQKRFPRSAIGLNDETIFAVTCNGYSPPEVNGDEGMSLEELASFMAGLGIRDALNLDGGSKATHIHRGNIVNKPRGGYADGYAHFPDGLPVLSAIVFEESAS